MKKIVYIISLVILIKSCNTIEEEKEQQKLYLFSYSNEQVNIYWYCYSSIGGFSVSKIDFINQKTKEINTIRSFYFTDIKVYKDTLLLQFWNSDTSGLNVSGIPYFKHVLIDTTGDQNKNGIDARISRMLNAKIDFKKPHDFISTVK